MPASPTRSARWKSSTSPRLPPIAHSVRLESAGRNVPVETPISRARFSDMVEPQAVPPYRKTLQPGLGIAFLAPGAQQEHGALAAAAGLSLHFGEFDASVVHPAVDHALGHPPDDQEGPEVDGGHEQRPHRASLLRQPRLA